MDRKHLIMILIHGIALGAQGCYASTTGSASGSSTADPEYATAEPAPEPEAEPAVAEAEPEPEPEPVVAETVPEPAPPEPEPEPEPELVAADPVRCRGAEEMELNGVRIDAGDSVAVQVTGRCVVTIRGSEIRSNVEAIQIAGSARIIVVGGSISGQPAVDARGGAQVALHGVTVAGEVNTRGRAAVETSEQIPEEAAEEVEEAEGAGATEGAEANAGSSAEASSDDA